MKALHKNSAFYLFLSGSILSASSSLQLSAYGAELSSEACRELGFSSNLLCSSCDLLGEFSLTKLQPECRHCCQQEAQMEARKVKRNSRAYGTGKQEVISCLASVTVRGLL